MHPALLALMTLAVGPDPCDHGVVGFDDILALIGSRGPCP
jgi:hypothetical protein